MRIAETEGRSGKPSSSGPSRDASLTLHAGLNNIRIDLKRERTARSAQLTLLTREVAEAIAAGDDARRHVTDVMIRTTEAALRELDDALARMKAGSYGRCERCTEIIPADRLEVRPTSRLCFPCQRTTELDRSGHIA